MNESLYVAPTVLNLGAPAWSNWVPRNGQWVVFQTADGMPIPFAHECPSKPGFYVGIFQKAARGTPVTLAKSGQTPVSNDVLEMIAEHIVVVNGDGANCPHVDGKGNLVGPTLRLNPRAVINLQPLLEKKDLPEKRLSEAHPDWNPQA